MNNTINNNEAFKNELFMDADFFSSSAKEAYEMGWTEEAREYEWKFNELLKKLQWLGWDKEYMGIA